MITINHKPLIRGPKRLLLYAKVVPFLAFTSALFQEPVLLNSTIRYLSNEWLMLMRSSISSSWHVGWAAFWESNAVNGHKRNKM
jgi:hypothetical protein